MENDPSQAPSSAPPPPDLTPRADPPPPPPDLPPDPPPPPPVQDQAAEGSSAKLTMDSEQEDEAKPGSDAAFEARVVAAIIDAFVAAGVYLVIGKFSGTLGWMSWIAYLLTKDALPFLEGQSIGKKLMKIRAVTMEGKTLTGDWQASFVRNLPLAIPFFGLVELFVLFTRKDREGSLRRLGDEWARTRVIVVAGPSGI